MIPNHIAPKLSALDLLVGQSVPPGGNWKNIPEEVPSQRLKQIRESYARGEGSRSTYYGRLHPDNPSYTISTYFSRPGNGCHLHYDAEQNRTLSFREAARLQSFPDSFVFEGGSGAVSNQIGNAIPPLLGFAIAKASNVIGQAVDLFAGAGGLALGLKWAGWDLIASNDIDEDALKTHSRNLSSPVVLGDITQLSIRDEITKIARNGRNASKGPLWVVGGPPCQGFSTAGNRRSRDDSRNSLFRDYISLLETLQPDAFVFENVTGILNMEGGAVFKEIKEALSQHCDSLRIFKVSADHFGVPQRRKRVILVGSRITAPFELGLGPLQGGLFGGPPISVKEALDDLPPLSEGENGTQYNYRFAPATRYQAFMRDDISAEDFYTHLPFRHEREMGIAV